MKKKFVCLVSLLVVVIVLSFSAFAPVSHAASMPNSAVSDNQHTNNILKSRFLNMLNHSWVYDNDFDSEEEIVNDSVIALLNMRDTDNDAYIKTDYVKAYIYNMFGIEISDFSVFNTQFPKLDGYVYIIPRGISQYHHQNASVSKNEDGSFTVTTDIKIENHDGDPISGKCVSLFVENKESEFGFNIISSNINDNLI